jgi:uncharacterized protein (DUF1800 family)
VRRATKNKKNSWLLSLTGTLLLAACGGGGGGDPASAGASPPPPAGPPPVTFAQAYRFLNQATFGATETEARRLVSLGDSSTAYARWIDEQLALPATTQLAYVQAGLPNPIPTGFVVDSLNTQRQDIWFQNSLRGPDQLRQRVAWALSQIMVVSQGLLSGYPFGLADYYDVLARDAFGDYRRLIEDVTLHPMMGRYLSMLGNQKPDPARNIRPDENYARELMQLFAIGLVELNPDGSIRRDGLGNPIPTYDQATIEGFAHIYTGWHWACAAGSPANCAFANTRATFANQILPMQAFAEQHDAGSKRMLTYTGAIRTSVPAGQTMAQDLRDALDNIAGHPNVAPFISKQLIQKLVTSNPSPAYVQRIVEVFNNDGTGRRGNLGAVVRAILLDVEARRDPIVGAGATDGKTKEPLLRLTQLWRAYGGAAQSGRYVNINAQGNFGQGPLTAPSVFNFFSPFFAPTGEIADRGLVAPELQIATENQNTLVTNYFYQQIFNRNSRSGIVNPDIVVIDIEPEVALAGNSAQLVNSVAVRLLGGHISQTLRDQAVASVNRVAASNPTQRVAEALWLIVSSPDFAVQP